MRIRRSTEADIDAIMSMIDHSRGLMRASGNMTQWVGYPSRDVILDDIRQGVSYIVESGQWSVASGQFPGTATAPAQLTTDHRPLTTPNIPISTFALVPGIEPTYGYIDHGRWIDDKSPYATVHRMAKAPGAANVASVAFAFAKEHYPYLRVDTHADNSPMRHILSNEGFVECGTVYMDDGAPRQAYEWWRYDEVPADMKAFVEQRVIPKYRHFDAAHNEQHVRRVIARAMACGHWLIATYVAAAMHDLGLAYGRERHHLESGRIIRACYELRQWFCEAEIEEIAQAAEDHRASAATPPRSLLGCIVAEADRDVEPETIVRRTVEYGLSHYPELDREGHWQRTLDHLHEKYAEGGYIKLWLEDSPNAAPLAELRTLIKDEPRLRILFDKYYKR